MGLIKPDLRTVSALHIMVVGGVLIIAILATIGGLWASLDSTSETTAPEWVLAVITAALAFLGGLFMPSPGGRD